MSDMFKDQVYEEFWSSVTEAEKAGRSSGTVMMVDINFGWKVFTKKDDGFTNDETFFPYIVGNKESIQDSRSKANKFIVDNGLEKNPFNVFSIKLIRSTVLNREPSWKEDKYFYLFPTQSRFDLSTLPVENRYLSIIQQDTYRQRDKNASHFCIKLKNLRFTFMRNLSTISCGFKCSFKH